MLIFLHFFVKMGGEYLHRVDLRLIEVMEVVIFRIYLTKHIFCKKYVFAIKQAVQ